MKYVSYIPEKITSDMKCIIMLHGVWSNEGDLFSLSDYFWKDVYVFSLRWPFVLRIGSYAWYPVDFSSGKAIYKSEDVESWYNEIASFISEIVEKYNIPPEKIYLMGFSQWAIMSYYTLWKSPETIWGIIALSWRIIREIHFASLDSQKYKNKKIFVGHGMMDQVIPFLEIEGVKKYLSQLGSASQIHKYPIWHTISTDELQDIKIFLK